MRNNVRVLVVDDDPGVLGFVRVSLSLSGYEVVTTSSGEEALQLARDGKFDIMLLDIVMFPTSGLDVLNELRTFSQLPVIVFTARNDIGNLAVSMGASGFIAKPFKPDEMVTKIRKTLGEEEK
jgi:DNA-binding response OmpR family regulator